MSNYIKTEDPEIASLIDEEYTRQSDGLEMIPSENYVSPAVREALASVLTNKYSEGYPGRRYYGGNEFIDDIETLAIERAKKLFDVPHANVQPYSGSPANMAVYMATCRPGDPIMGLNLSDGGHLTHGWKVSASAMFYQSVPYHVKEDGHVDIDEVWRLAKEHRPHLIWCGATAYVYEYEFEKFAEIADSVGAYFAADIAHVAGLVVAGVHKSPKDYAHIITTTTHKTLRGPRGAIIMVTNRGFAKDPDLADKIDKAVFPGLQGGPHDHTTAAIAVALHEAASDEFRTYGKQIVANAKALAEALKKEGLTLVGDGTQNHLILVDLTPLLGAGAGILAQVALEAAGITANKNTIPNEPSSPFYPSGIRLGTPAITTRGMKEDQMRSIGSWIKRATGEVASYRMPAGKEERKKFLLGFQKEMSSNETLRAIARDVTRLCKQFPVP
jgi:glycine hydroxymethyltransferase